MKTLYSVCKTKDKIWKEFPEGSHNDTVAEEGYFDAIDDFITHHVLSNTTKGREK
jgi:hypothetical protein